MAEHNPTPPADEDRTPTFVVTSAVVGLLGALVVLLCPIPFGAPKAKEFLGGAGNFWAVAWALLGAAAGAGIGWAVANGRSEMLFHVPRARRARWALMAFLLIAPAVYQEATRVVAATPAAERTQPAAPTLLQRIPVPYYLTKYWILFAACVVAAFCYCLQLARLERDAEVLVPVGDFSDPATNAERRAVLDLFIDFARELRGCLLGLGMLLTMLILSQATLRLALEKQYKTEVIQLQQILGYSLYYTFVMMVVYVPVHLRLVAKARRVVDAGYPLGEGMPHDILKRRDDTLRLIGLGGDWLDVMKSGVIVLSPLLATIFAQALPSK